MGGNIKDFIYKDSLKNNFSYISILYESTTDLYDHVMPYNTNIYVHMFIYILLSILYVYIFMYICNKYLCVLHLCKHVEPILYSKVY